MAPGQKVHDALLWRLSFRMEKTPATFAGKIVGKN